MQNADIVLWVDNFGVVSGLATGLCRSFALGSVLQAFQLALAKYRSSLWVEHMESDANLADGGSRVGTSCPFAKKLGVQLVEVDSTPWPSNVLTATAKEWLVWLDQWTSSPQ